MNGACRWFHRGCCRDVEDPALACGPAVLALGPCPAELKENHATQMFGRDVIKPVNIWSSFLKILSGSNKTKGEARVVLGLIMF